jgi:hypothetical protein
VSNSLKIIERVRLSTNTGTDYAVAKALGMSQSNLAGVIKGTRGLGPTAIFAAAKILRVDAQDLFYLVREDRAKSEAEKLHWRSLCAEGIRASFDIAGKTAAAFTIATTLILLLISSGISRTAEAVTVSHPMHYAPFRRRLRRWLAAARSRATLATGILANAA